MDDLPRDPVADAAAERAHAACQARGAAPCGSCGETHRPEEQLLTLLELVNLLPDPEARVFATAKLLAHFVKNAHDTGYARGVADARAGRVPADYVPPAAATGDPAPVGGAEEVR